MKKLIKSKLFLQVIVASMIATLATVGIVGATTTIGDSITTAGTVTAATITDGTASLASGALTGLTTALTAAQGGTGWATINSNALLLGNGANKIATTSAGTAGYVLMYTSGAPTWVATSSVAAKGANSDITSLSGLTTALTAAQGGTGWTTINSNALLLGNGANAIATTSAGTNGFVLSLVNGVPTWAATTTLTTISGTLPIANGGTNLTTYTTGDVLYASAANTLSKLTATTNGYVLSLSAGVPAWVATTTYAASGANSDITSLSGLTTALTAAQGGTGWATINSNALLLGNGANAIATTSAGTAGYVLMYTSGAPTWAATTSLATLASPSFTGTVNFSGYATTTGAGLISPRNYPASTSGSCTLEGAFSWNTATKKVCVCDGTNWLAATSTNGVACF